VANTEYQEFSQEVCDTALAKVDAMSCDEIYVQFKVPQLLALAD